MVTRPPAPTGCDRRRLPSTLALLCAGAVLAAAGPACAEAPVSSAEAAPLTLLVFVRPPYYVPQPDGNYGGEVAGRVARALNRAGVRFSWRLLPPAGSTRPLLCSQSGSQSVGADTVARINAALTTLPGDRP